MIKLLLSPFATLLRVVCSPTRLVTGAMFAMSTSSRRTSKAISSTTVDGEVVYCKQPDGSNVIGSDGLPQVFMVTKPIYGMPQAGRRLQRKVFPWCTDVMGLRQLDDSDDCVFVWDERRPEGK